jgi:class 3 adenylate cyclase
VSRRLVTVLFTDLVGWTGLGEELDPEPLQQFLERYYETCVTTVERNGGVVEKFIGDAIMAVFGAERSGEDDALRALTAAVQTRAEVGQLDIALLATAGRAAAAPAVHCGIAAGEALVTRSVRAGLRIVGDVVNLAARLQSAAAPGEILVNEVTARLVRPHAVLAPVPPIRLKGKREPVTAWRAVELAAPTASGRALSPMIDRDSELARLRDAYRTVARTGQAQVVLVTGTPGIGKSRLIRELVEAVTAEESPRPLTAAATHLALGSAGSYAALAQVTQTLLGDPGAAGRVRAASGGRLEQVLSRIQAPPPAAGDDPAPGAEEITWAMRELLTRAGTPARPRVVVWDDLDSAEPLLLDIVADLARSLRDIPVLTICVARGPLRQLSALEPTPWRLLELRALSALDTVCLVGQLLARGQAGEVTAQSADVLDRVSEDCAGNPLFAELMVETLALGYSLGEVPPTITALIGAMIDRLPPVAAELLAAASVVGTVFTAARLATVDVTAVPSIIDDLVRRQLIEPNGGPGTYRFAQRLVHAVVYGRVDKRQRIGLHRRLADQGVSPGLHLEAVVRLLHDVAPGDPQLPLLSARAAAALLSEGTHALRRRNLPAAVDLLTRAGDIAASPAAQDSPADCRTVTALRLSDALLLSGDLAGAQAVIARPAESAPQTRLGRACRLQRAILALRAGQPACAPDTGGGPDLVAELRRDRGDDVNWCRLHQLRMLQQIGDGRFRAAERSARQALRRAVRMADGYERDRLLAALCEVGQWSPTPVPEKLAFCRGLAARFADDRCLLVPVLAAQARFTALLGQPDETDEVLGRARQVVTDLRLPMAGILVDQVAGLAASLAGAHEVAESHFRAAVRGLDASGHRPAALSVRALAEREHLQWQPDDPAAADAVRDLDELSDQMDLRGRVLTLGVAARVTAAACGSPGPHARAARALLDRTDDACLRGDVLADLAAAYRQAGDEAGARSLAGSAAASYRAVGALAPLRRIRPWL